jgi:hypothetical protein
VRDNTLAAEIVRRWKCGIVVGEVGTLFSAELVRLRQDPAKLQALGNAGKNAFRLAYNWDLMEKRLLGLYEELF